MKTWVPTKSEGDEREYRIVELENELMCLLVCDKETDKAGAAMDVAVGHFSDPDELPGLAHFNEHMLFLGTEKYPDENSYSTFLSSNSGKSNAFTAMENTNYMFDVGHGQLEEALDRFSQFFTGPLFTQSATDREINAVHNENAKNLLNDHWRLFQFLKSTSNPTNPFSKFGTGNLTTLKDIPAEQGISTRDGLLAFHGKYYSSNVSKLVVLGRESLDELQALVTTKFSGYANKKIAVPKFEPDAFQGGLGKLYRVVPVKDLRTLSLLWALPYIEKEHYHTKPEHVLSHLVGHEGDGSILQLLKAKGWANELSAGLNHSTTAFSAFSVSIDLCEEGLEHITEIVAIVFQYLRVLSEATDAKWAETYKEVSDVDEMSFRFKSKESPFNYCSSLAGSMHEYAPEEVLSGPFLTSKFDLPLIKSMLASLQKADLRVHVISQTFKGATTEKEKWYDTEYSVEDFNTELLTAIHSPTANSALSMPSPNEFIATDFALRSANDVPADAAPILIESPGVKCWWKLDQKYLKPKANVVVRLDNPVAYASPRAAMLTTLYTSLLEDSLVTYAYHADVAGLSYSLNLTSTGLQLMFRGYNHKLSVLAQKVLEEMRTMRARPDRFALIKEAVERELKNFSLEQPYQHAMYAQAQSLENLWHNREKLAVLGSLTPADLDTHVKLLLSEGLEVEMLVHGNMDKADAVAVAAMVAGNFTPLPAAQIPSQRVVQLAPRHQYLLQAREYNDKDQNSAAYLSFQFGEDTLETRSRAEFLAHLLKEPCFNQLRTVEQLGYLVFSGLQAQRGVLSLRVLLQSSERPAHYLHQRAEAFLEHTFRAVLSNLDDESFERERNSVLADIEEKDKTLNQETNRYWSEVVLRRYTFDRREQKAAAVRAVTKAELLVFFETHVAVNSERRLLSLQYFGAGHAMPGEEGFVVTPSESEAKLPKAATDGAEGEATSSAEATSDEPKADLSAPPVDNAKVCKIEDLEFSKFRLSMPLYPDFC